MYNPYSLKGKTILVTGASSGIGRATAIECSKMGATVVVNGRNETRLKEVYEVLDRSFGQEHLMVVADVSTEKGVDYLTSSTPELDGLSSNAGISVGSKPIKFVKEEELIAMFQTNSFSNVILIRMLVKKKILKKDASCVFTASIGGNKSFVSGSSIYGMTKASLDSFVKYAAIELAPKGVRCNSVCPGMIVTPLTAPEGAITEEDLQKDAEKYLLKRYGNPEEVAKTTVFLLSDASSFITGTSIVVDGGYTVNH